MINIIIVDDHQLFRTTLGITLSNYPDFFISADTDSGATLFALLPTTPCDIVLLDINLPYTEVGIGVARNLRQNYPAVKILAISCEGTAETVDSLLQLGIDGFISKQAGKLNEIAQAIRSIMDGYEYFGNDIAKMIHQIYISKKRTSEVTPEFTVREKEIIELCRDGLLGKEIAYKLNICLNTVNNHKKNIFKKLNINNTMEMVQYALKHKIIQL
jgi:DNA-binding NarL/FixJ family response regulator